MTDSKSASPLLGGKLERECEDLCAYSYDLWALSRRIMDIHNARCDLHIDREAIPPRLCGECFTKIIALLNTIHVNIQNHYSSQ
jgi:hypothetical protein